jgi:4-amino-4-deoxy-L-arabinose transferase-like glycosyltransferase
MSVFAALACSVKVTGLPLGFMFIGMVFAIQWARRRMDGRQFIVSSVACFTLSLIWIYALAPNLWPNLRMIKPSRVVSEARHFMSDPSTPEVSGWDRLSTYPQLANVAVPLKLPRMFPAWKRSLTRNADLHPQYKWPVHKFWPFTSAVFIQSASFPGQAVFVLLGVVAVAARVKFSRQNLGDPALVLLLFTALNYLFGLAFQPMVHARWYLPTVIASAALAASGGVWICTVAARGIWPEALKRRR